MSARPVQFSVADKVAFLRDPNAYPGNPAAVTAIETHMSWVFLVDDLVYKLKKPVRHEFLDFSTLAARRRNCVREVRLNRRLAPDVYLGVVPLTVQPGHRLRLGGNGVVVDWLVEMRRLPAERMLDAAIRGGGVTRDDIRRLGQLLTDFYRNAAPVEMSEAAYHRRYAAGIRENHAELVKPQYGLPADRIDRLTQAQRRFIEHDGEILTARARRRKIVEAHGDLRPEHICLISEPRIIDCLEFKRAFRLLDPVDELSYLAMECERLRAPWIGDRLLRRYRTDTGDAPAVKLVFFYKTFRACVRARIAIWHIADHDVRETGKWRSRALDYLDLAESYVTRL